MSLFNLRRGGQSSKSTPGLGAPAESLEIVRKRAKHRLIGSAVLVLLGVIGFPLLFDTQPRPVSVSIPIEIPSKQGAKPLGLPAEAVPAATASGPAGELEAPPKAVTVNSAATQEASVVAAPAAPAPSPAPIAKQVSAPVVAQVAPASPKASNDKPVDKPAERSTAAPKADELRLVVQVGAFADVAKARDARLKLEKAGLKTYTQVAETKDGKRIRVRVGPYASKAEADKAAKQIKALDLPAAILTL